MSGANQASPQTSQAPLSIGGLSRATGIAVETLRTWERRYGFPSPVRTPSGHRRYTLETAERLRRVQAAIARGHRASAVLTCSESQLEALLAMDDAPEATPPPRAPEPAPSEPPPTLGNDLPSQLESLLTQIRRFDGARLDQAFEVAWQRLGARGFVTELAVALLREIGDQWSRGEVSIAHEHFASERLRDFLSRQWRPLTNRSTGPRVACVTLSGEQHSLPLHLSAVLLALEGARPVILGADTPEEEIARAASTFAADAVLVAVSRAASSEVVLEQVERLRRLLPAHVTLAVGGSRGRLPQGTVRLGRLDEVPGWARRLSGV